MRKFYSLSALLLASLTIAGAGCFGPSQTDRRSNASDTSTDTVSADDEVSVALFDLGEDATAGDIVHNVATVEQLDVIPASATLPEWELIAEDTPADEGFTWLHLTGTVTNNSKESQTVTSGSVYIVDSEGNEFDVSTDTTIYVDSDKSPIYIDVQPTQTVEWEGYFSVPQDATGLTFVGNDLSFFPEAEVRVDLGL